MLLGFTTGSTAGEGIGGWLSGDWYLTLGATGLVAPNFEGGKKYLVGATPIISLGKAGGPARFSSRNDNISLALIDDGSVRAGLTGKFLWGRDNDADELRGLDPVRWGGEVGGFFEVYPLTAGCAAVARYPLSQRLCCRYCRRRVLSRYARSSHFGWTSRVYRFVEILRCLLWGQCRGIRCVGS